MRVGRGTVVSVIVVVAVVALIAWAMSGRAVSVDVGVVRRGPVVDSVEEEARTRCVDRYLLSSPVAGRLLRVAAREGDEVEPGEVVARIDPLALTSLVEKTKAGLRELDRRLVGVGRRRPKEGELERAKLLESMAAEAIVVAERELDESRAALTKCERDLDRAKALGEGGTITRDELEDAELALTRARAVERARDRMVRIRRLEVHVAALDRAILDETKHDVDWEEAAVREQIAGVRADLAVLEDDLERTEIRSPIAGRVLRRHRESETMVAAGEPILEVGDPARLEVEADVLSEDAAGMTVGQAVEVRGRALGDRTVVGTILRIHPGAFEKISSLGVEQQRVTIVADFGAEAPGLGDGFRVDLRVIRDAREDAVLVPEGALFRRADHWFVFRVADGRAELVRVTVGLGDGREREVLEGLAEGDEVVLHPPNDLEDGARVEAR